MAFQVQKKDPLDLQPRKGVGVGYPLSTQGSNAVFEITYESKEAVKANLLTYFLTGKNERILNPNLGSPLREFIFENINDTTSLRFRNKVEEDLRVLFPRVQVLDLNITGNTADSSIVFYLRYAIVDTIYQNEEIVMNIEQ